MKANVCSYEYHDGMNCIAYQIQLALDQRDLEAEKKIETIFSRIPELKVEELPETLQRDRATLAEISGFNTCRRAVLNVLAAAREGKGGV